MIYTRCFEYIVAKSNFVPDLFFCFCFCFFHDLSPVQQVTWILSVKKAAPWHSSLLQKSSFMICLLCSKSLGYCLWRKQHHDTVNYSKKNFHDLSTVQQVTWILSVKKAAPWHSSLLKKIFFMIFLLCRKSLGYCLWRKQHHDTVHYSKIVFSWFVYCAASHLDIVCEESSTMTQFTTPKIFSWFVYCAASHLDIVCEESSTMIQSTTPKIWKQQAELRWIHARFHQVWLSRWGQCKGFEKCWM